MTVTIKVELRGSAQHETPERLKRMVSCRMNEMIRNDALMNIFVASYSVEVE